jgi:hypothetical protein
LEQAADFIGIRRLRARGVEAHVIHSTSQ